MAAFTFAQVLEPDTDRLGGDFATIPLSAPDPALCATACRADARCLAFTYVKPAAGTDGIARCALKSSVPTPYPNACCISGLNPNAPPVERPQVLDISTRDQVDLLGMDYRCFDLPSPELELCRQTCTDSELCDSFTYVRPVPDRPAARCCLKSGVPSPSLNACCTSGIVLRPPKQKPNLTVDGKAGVHPPRNEVEWQACEMARDVAEILAFSRSRKIPDEGVDVQVVGPASSEIIHLQIKTSPDRPAALASVRLAPFLVDASSLDEVVLATLSSLGIAPESVKGPPPPGLLERLTDFHARVIAQEARRVAEELDRRPLDPGLHEEAALCLASLAIKEQAGQFSDQRDAIRRGLVHLSLARGLRSPESLSTTGVVAEAALLTVAGRATSARRRLVGMNPAMGVAGLEAWRGALDELGSLDWRVNLKPVTGTLLQRTVHYRTLAARLGTIDAQDFIGSRNTLLLTEWPRAAFAHEWSVGFGNVFARSAPALEAAELVEVAKVLNVPVSTPPNLSALLDSSSQRCITRSSTGWRPRGHRLEDLEWILPAAPEPRALHRLQASTDEAGPAPRGPGCAQGNPRRFLRDGAVLSALGPDGALHRARRATPELYVGHEARSGGLPDGARLRSSPPRGRQPRPVALHGSEETRPASGFSPTSGTRRLVRSQATWPGIRSLGERAGASLSPLASGSRGSSRRGADGYDPARTAG